MELKINTIIKIFLDLRPEEQIDPEKGGEVGQILELVNLKNMLK